jgi:cell division protein FtsB
MSDLARQKRLFLGILIGFSLFFVVGYTSRLLKKNQVEQEVRQWEERIGQAEQKGARLAAELTYVRSEAYIHEKARETLGLVQPDDTLIVEVAPLGSLEAKAGAAPALTTSFANDAGGRGLPNWQQWLSLFWPVAEDAGHS